jgi:hypothetical protein
MTTTIKHIEHGVVSDTYTRLDWTVSSKDDHDDAAKTLAYSGWAFRFHANLSNRLGGFTRAKSGNGRSIWTKGCTAYVVTELQGRVNGNIGRAMPRYGFGGES